jgi:hypothetical protein
MYKRFKFVKPYKAFDGVITPGNELTVLNSTIYYNGGMIEPSFYEEFKELVQKEMKKSFYLKEVPIPYNKV